MSFFVFLPVWSGRASRAECEAGSRTWLVNENPGNSIMGAAAHVLYGGGRRFLSSCQTLINVECGTLFFSLSHKDKYIIPSGASPAGGKWKHIVG